MAFVTGTFCFKCNTFVVNSTTKHNCVQNGNLYALKPAPKNVASNIPVVKKKSSTIPVSSSTSSCPVISSVNKESIIKNCRKTSLFDSLFVDEEETTIDTETADILEVNKESSNANSENKYGLSQDETTTLISLIEISKPLWNHKLSLGDRSEVVKNNLWNEIFVQFEGKFSILNLKKSWKYIREKYTREKRQGVSGCEGGKKKEWVHFKNLKFLDDVLTVQKRTIDSIGSELDEHCAPKPSKRSLVETHIGSLIEELKHSRPIPPKENQQSPISEEEKFSVYLASILSDVPRQRQIILQAKIIALVAKEFED